MDDNALESFVHEARAYCAFIELAGSMALGERLAAARMRLLALYGAGITLPPHPEPGDVSDAPSPAQPASWQDFGEKDFYWEIFDPYVDAPTVGGSLSDDLLDVYFDVHRGLALWDGAHHAEAVWEWRFHLDAHWGDHAVDALRALHRACSAIPAPRSARRGS